MNRIFTILVFVNLTVIMIPDVFGQEPEQQVPPSQVQAGDVSGIYECRGTNPDGTSYEGIVGIVKVQETFIVQWIFSANSAVTGVGILSNGVFAVSYFGGAPTIVVYKVEGNRLVGEWTMGDIGRVYAEVLTKVGEHPQQPEAPPQRQTQPIKVAWKH